ncbi:hydrogenase maturation nickel metallochaperone HypA [Kitasatospora sp. NBC_01250]|uniref:hydrogenase maturation nickel metallochaperone HypA n=1 Tax=unclassified Kitasatospora TaxID=2633591 RepID=UPI002E15165D|nr:MULTISPECIES: hydrogenase maturation nickel metallochaperone HypA [unclassified Kitasatospora]WSJ70242.1 hydrogenase maturation nickel metallochaperone HypA [Kitasatospora sp. NBC_01302]
MHEMSIALAVIEQVEQAAAEHGAQAVEEVLLQVGELAGVVPQALDFCYELACADTVLAGSTLTVEPVAARARCVDCGREWAVGMPPDLACPGCGGARTELLAGRELQILQVRWAADPVLARADQEG